jgi:hypothetical protein
VDRLALAATLSHPTHRRRTPTNNLGDDPNHKIHKPTIPPHGCHHTHEHKGDYHITATTYFDVEWTGAGQHGAITGLTVARETDYPIGEIRVVIVNR